MKTAYQIADELEERNAPYEDDAANFIRQQQAEIEALKAQVLAWENAEVPVEVMADIVEELERRGFITK